MAAAIGIDIGGTHIRSALVSAAGDILARQALPSSPDPAVVQARCLDLVAALRTPEVVALGIGVPGQVIADERRILSGGYVDLSGTDFVAAMEAATGLAVVVENDATMALRGEAARGAAQGARNVVMLTIGTGIGGAVLERGEVLRGRGTAGQLGHLTVEAPGRPCVCGRRGCVETVSSGTAFGVHLAEAGLPPETRAQDLLARPDDPAARGVILAWAAPLRRAIDALIATCAPDLVVLGGGAGAAAVAALATVRPRASWFDAPVVAASLGDDAGMIGAALAALPRPQPKRAVLVNGVPASGKSTVTAALARATGWTVLTLDTIKDPFLAELPPGDRLFNRALGRASYAAIFDLMRDTPPGATFIVDAWFGFQPPEVLEAGLARAGVSATLELWCAAPPNTIGARYAARVDSRAPGHPGHEYVPELIALAAGARPTGRGPVLEVDTTTPPDAARLTGWIAGHWPDALLRAQN
jgi:glucokinase